MADFDADMLKLLKGVKSFKPLLCKKSGTMMKIRYWLFQRKDLIFVFNFNPKKSFLPIMDFW